MEKSKFIIINKFVIRISVHINCSSLNTINLLNTFYLLSQILLYIKNRIIFAEAFGTTWTKQYCTYQKEKKEFTMIPYNQLTGKFVSKKLANT